MWRASAKRSIRSVGSEAESPSGIETAAAALAGSRRINPITLGQAENDNAVTQLRPELDIPPFGAFTVVNVDVSLILVSAYGPSRHD